MERPCWPRQEALGCPCSEQGMGGGQCTSATLMDGSHLCCSVGGKHDGVCWAQNERCPSPLNSAKHIHRENLMWPGTSTAMCTKIAGQLPCRGIAGALQGRHPRGCWGCRGSGLARGADSFPQEYAKARGGPSLAEGFMCPALCRGPSGSHPGVQRNSPDPRKRSRELPPPQAGHRGLGGSLPAGRRCRFLLPLVSEAPSMEEEFKCLFRVLQPAFSKCTGKGQAAGARGPSACVLREMSSGLLCPPKGNPAPCLHLHCQ